MCIMDPSFRTRRLLQKIVHENSFIQKAHFHINLQNAETIAKKTVHANFVIQKAHKIHTNFTSRGNYCKKQCIKMFHKKLINFFFKSYKKAGSGGFVVFFRGLFTSEKAHSSHLQFNVGRT